MLPKTLQPPGAQRAGARAMGVCQALAPLVLVALAVVLIASGTTSPVRHPVAGAALLADDAYLPALHEMLTSATTAIDVTMFSCVLPEDPRPEHPVRRVLDRLAERSTAGVRVRVVLDRGIPPGRLKEGDTAPSERAAAYLRQHGIDVRWDEDDRTTHSKTLVIDGRWCLIGSSNWTASAFAHNREQNVALDSPGLAGELTAQFEDLWRRGTPVR